MRIGTSASWKCRTSSLLFACALLPGVAACGSSGTSGSQSPPSTQQAVVSPQDEFFATQLVALSQQLVDLTNVLMGRTDDEIRQKELEDLGNVANERVALAQSWLQSASQGPASSAPSGSTPGILTDQQFDALLDSDGLQLQQAIEVAAKAQLDGTIAICDAEVAGGSAPALVEAAGQLKSKAHDDYQVLARPLPTPAG